jgi:hypothetical protein
MYQKAISSDKAKFSSSTLFSFCQSNGPIPNTLQKVNIAIVNQQECNDVYSQFGYGIYEGHICADVPEGNQGSCNVSTTSWTALVVVILIGTWLLISGIPTIKLLQISVI